MNSKGISATLVATSIITACGGGSSGSAPADNNPPPVNQALGGLWYGTLTNDMNTVTEEFVALSADDGRVRLISVDSDVQFLGSVSVDGTALDGTVRAFADQGVNWLDGSHVVDSAIAGVIDERDSLSGSWQNASGEGGTFEFFYDILGDKDSNTALLEAVWTGYDDSGNPEVTFSIDASGVFTGQNAQGCSSSGQFTAIDPRYNLYDVQSVVENCGLAGSYSGFAILADLLVSNDALLVSIDDGSRTVLLGLER